MTRDLRKYQRQTRAGLISGFFLLVFILGDGLIYVLYGKGAALMGLLCLGLVLLPVLVVVLVLFLVDRVIQHADRG